MTSLLNSNAESASAYLPCGSFCASAPSYGLSENVGVVAVIVAKLKFRDVQRHIFGAHLVERADDAALKERPKTFNRVRVNSANHVFLFGVIDDGVRERAAKLVVTTPRVGREQADLVGHSLI